MDPDSGTNLAVLYATLIIIIGTVVSEWPPKRLDAIFWISFFVTSLIVLRIGLLIWNLDPLFNRS